MVLATLERPAMSPLRFLLLLTLLTRPLLAADLLLLVGAPGEEDYGPIFAETAATWEQTARTADLTLTRIENVSTDGLSPRDQLIHALAGYQTDDPDAAPLWIVYVGHGTYDLRTARLNLIGPDVSTNELRDWLQHLGRPLVFIHGGSASAPFISALSAPDRLIITATESGNEVNFTRFGRQFARAVIDPDADIDQDGQTSLLEAFVTAAQQVQAFYLENNRLATEHALLDDNGDGRGTPYDFFHGTRLAERPTDPTAIPDGSRARTWSLLPSAAERALSPAQRARRDDLEDQLEQVRASKDAMLEADYFDALERIFRALAEIYDIGS